MLFRPPISDAIAAISDRRPCPPPSAVKTTIMNLVFGAGLVAAICIRFLYPPPPETGDECPEWSEPALPPSVQVELQATAFSRCLWLHGLHTVWEAATHDEKLGPSEANQVIRRLNNLGHCDCATSNGFWSCSFLGDGTNNAFVHQNVQQKLRVAPSDVHGPDIRYQRRLVWEFSQDVMSPDDQGGNVNVECVMMTDENASAAPHQPNVAAIEWKVNDDVILTAATSDAGLVVVGTWVEATGGEGVFTARSQLVVNVVGKKNNGTTLVTCTVRHPGCVHVTDACTVTKLLAQDCPIITGDANVTSTIGQRGGSHYSVVKLSRPYSLLLHFEGYGDGMMSDASVADHQLRFFWITNNPETRVMDDDVDNCQKL